MRRIQPRQVLTGLLLVALGISTYVNISLATRARDLADRHGRLRDRIEFAFPGMYVPEYRATSISGDSIILLGSASNQRELLLFFTTTCPYCRASLPAWRRLASAAGQSGVNVVGVALDSLHRVAAYRDEHQLEFPIVLLTDRRYGALYRANGVPLVVVASGGRVLMSRVGELTSTAAIDSVTSWFTAPIPWKSDEQLRTPASIGRLEGLP